ncbi:MAG TPA: ABC transporter permease [Flavitalea sp.]|nr:ABC transporter permease [Flavitalea sp.]
MTFRSLFKNKIFSFINVFGLSVGLATCLLLMLYIFDEIEYDKHHENASRIYRVAMEAKAEKWAGTPAPMANSLKTDFPEIDETTRVLNFPGVSKMLLTNEKNNKQFYETHGYYADSGFFKVFSYNFKEGNPNTALAGPNTLVISEEIANKLFGRENPIDKIVSVEIRYGKSNYTIKGIFKNTGQKSHINARFFLSMKNGDVGQWVATQTAWSVNNIFYTYFKLRPGTNANVLEKKLPEFLSRNGGADLKASGDLNKRLFLQPLLDIHLKSAIGFEMSVNGSVTYIYIFGSIAIFLLLIACINFMNLSTARSEKRAKEVGVRKVMGAHKNSLIWQFLCESTIMALIAIFFALVVVLLVLPVFNTSTQKNIVLFQNPVLLLWIAGLTLFTGLLAGLYPAFYLSSFKPIAILKGKLINTISATSIRKGLVVFQFVVSVSLILVSMIIWQQMNYIKKQDLGFNKNQQLILPLQNTSSASSYVTLKNELLKNQKIISVAAGSSYPGIQLVENIPFHGEGKNKDDRVTIHFARVHDDYIETLGCKLLYGRDLSKSPSADSNAIVLNETAIKELGYDIREAIGKKIYYSMDKQTLSMQIVGVVKDFNYRSLHEPITPYGLIKLKEAQAQYLIANAQNGTFQGIIGAVKKVWDKINPDLPFEYSFLDQDFQKSYQKEERTSGIIIYFMAITIFIACLGLLGLASFTAEQRRKEVGIRKVLGASVMNVTGLLAKDFLKLVMGGIVIASPISYYLGNKWLQDFAYRINISWWMFVLAGLSALLIAFATVSVQAIKAAVANPVKSLKQE